MKKRDEIEDEILDEEEFLDDEEEILDDDEILDDEEVEEEEDEKPAKVKKAKKVPASAKGGKKKLGKGAKAGIIVGSVVAFLAIAAILVIWVVMPMLSAKIENASYQGIIGNTKPTGVTAVEEVNSSMTTFEMLEAALANYDAADYAANICVVGGVSTKIGPIAVDQAVQSMKVRVGKATDADAQYFGRSVSYGFTGMAEEYYTTNITSGSVKYRNGSKVDKKTGYVKDWNNGEEEFEDFEEFKSKKTTDFTKIWSYDVTNKTVTKDTLSSKPTYDKKEGYYILNVAVDVSNESAIKAYKEVMEYQLKDNMGADVKGLTFTELSFEIGVWDNGFIRYIGIKESYVMNLVMSGLTVSGVNISNSYMNEYSYDKTEKIPYEGAQKSYKDLFKLFPVE